MKTNGIVSPYFENGVFAGARVTIGDEDFVIAPKDYRHGKEMPWQEAMDALKTDRLSTFNYRQICLTMAYRKEVDKVLVDNGGDSLVDLYWTCAEFSTSGSFYYNGYNGKLGIDNKHSTCSVRPIKNLSQF